jgi:hypothetical protein
LLRSIGQDEQLSSYIVKVERREFDLYSTADEISKSRNFLTD